MAVNITILRPGFVGNTLYVTGDTPDVSEADAVAAISSRIARYTDEPLQAQTASTEALLQSFEKLSDEKKEAFRVALDITGGGGGGSNDASDLTQGILPAARLQTFNTLSPVPSAMGALVVDVTKALNVKAVTADSTLTFSATPAAGTRFGVRISADGTDRTITIPSSYSTARNATITSFVLAANSTAYVSWEYTGSAYNIVGDPLTKAQAAAAAGVGTTDLVEFGGQKVKTITKAGNYTVGTDSANEAYGAIVRVTGNATITLPAISPGMSVTVIAKGAVTVGVKPNAADKLFLEGTALDDGDKATSTGATGDVAVFTYDSADGWLAITNGWTDGGA